MPSLPPAEVDRGTYIMMGGGALALLMSILMGNRGMPGSGYSSRTTTHVDPNTGTRVDETRVDGL